MMMSKLNTKNPAGRLVMATLGTLVLLLSAPAVSADLEDVVLTADGQMASVSAVYQPQSRLVLRIGGDTLDVPGSDSADSAPLGLLRSRTGEIHVVWLASDAEGSHLRFSTRTADTWDGPHTLLAGGEPVTFDEAPQLLVEADRLRLALGEDSLDLERQVIHVTWREDGLGIRYSAFVLRNGRYVGWNEIVTVSRAFLQAHLDTEPTDMADHLSAIASVSSADRGGVLLTLADDDKGRLGTLHLGAVSLASEVLADSVHDHLLDSADLFDPGDLSALSDEIRGHIVLVGSTLDFDDAMSAFFSERIESWIRHNGDGFGWDLESLAGATRAESLDLSQSVYRSTLQTSDGGEIPVFDLVDFLDSNGHRDEFSRLMRLSVVADLTAPENVGDDVEVHVSSDGSAMALSWVDPETGRVHWTEGRHGAWSESKSLATSESTDEAAIRQLISESIR